MAGSQQVDVYATHLSYDRTTQCAHAHEILEIMKKESAGSVDTWVLTGDLNIYRDHEVVIDIFAGSATLPKVSISPRSHSLPSNPTLSPSRLD